LLTEVEEVLGRAQFASFDQELLDRFTVQDEGYVGGEEGLTTPVVEPMSEEDEASLDMSLEEDFEAVDSEIAQYVNTLDFRLT
jgi:hypothetical protein